MQKLKVGIVGCGAIVNGTPLTVKPEQAMVVTQILEAIYESAKQNQTVYFE